jgi:hypothetical protein
MPHHGLLEPPTTAAKWESFLLEASHPAAGHRGILGGGAWETKYATLAERMCTVTWDRICEMLRYGDEPTSGRRLMEALT